MQEWLPWVIGIVAFLYAAVGHAGATGYLAVMTLAGTAPAAIRPTALALNVIVAAIGTVQFARAGHFRGGLFLPLVVASAPCALLGGTLSLPLRGLEALLAAVLALSAVRQVVDSRRVDEPVTAPRPLARHLTWPALLALGAGVGLLSGLTGVGGGVFLTPVLLALRVAPLKTVAAVTAPFILVNSLAGLAGRGAAGGAFDAVSWRLAAAVAIGGLLGAQAGAFQLPVRSLRVVLAGVLAIASLKLLASSLFPTAG